MSKVLKLFATPLYCPVCLSQADYPVWCETCEIYEFECSRHHIRECLSEDIEFWCLAEKELLAIHACEEMVCMLYLVLKF